MPNLFNIDFLDFLELLEKFKAPYIDFEDLMKNKKATGRLKDLADIEQLSKIKKNL